MKERHPNIPIVCGGEHFSGLPKESMEQAPVDLIIRGEGEEAAVEVFGGLQMQQAGGRVDWSLVPGIWYRDDAGQPVESGEKRSRTKEIDGIAWPAWDLIDIDVYNEHQFINGLNQGKTMRSSRRAAAPTSAPTARRPTCGRPAGTPATPRDVVDEMQRYKEEYGATNFPFQDLTAILKRD